jgi:gamma-glutamyltranspeptidase / glutathione hydrolase
MPTMAPYVTQYAPTGMVASIDQLASSAGVAMLRAGGSAADAAIAANAALAVTAQHLCGLGGDLFALVHRTGDEQPACLNASGRAGSGADPERLRAEGHETIPGQGDIRATPVPGCVDGWVALHKRFGRLPLGELLEPARAYAQDGFPASPTLAGWTASEGLQGVPHTDDFTAGGPLPPGGLIRRPGVARTLRAIAEHGRQGFYQGEFGERLLELGNGEYTVDDLARSQADWVEPISVEAWNRRVWTVPPNSQGYITIAAAWIAQGLDLPDDPADDLWAHLLVEALRQAGFDRDDVLHEGASGAELIAADRLEPRRREIDPERVSAPGGVHAASDTMYLCAVDGEGMGVSLIQSNYVGFGSMVVVPELRIFLQNRGAAFSLEPGHPAEYGPGRRPPHTLAPALVTNPDGSLSAVLGTMGGHAQPEIVLQLLARHYAAGEAPGDVLAAPRFILGRPGGVEVEDHAPSAWFQGLEARGHAVVRQPAWSHSFGHAHLIAVEDHRLAGAADPRSLSGAAVAY